MIAFPFFCRSQSRLPDPGVVERVVHRRPPVADIQRAAGRGRLRAGLGGRTGTGQLAGRHAGADGPPVAAAAGAARQLPGRVPARQSSAAAALQQLSIPTIVPHTRLPGLLVLQPQPAAAGQRLRQTGGSLDDYARGPPTRQRMSVGPASFFAITVDRLCRTICTIRIESQNNN